MYTTTIDVKLLLGDAQRAAALESLPVCESCRHTASAAVALEELGAADLIVCDGQAATLVDVRNACRDNAVVVLWPSGAAPVSVDGQTAHPSAPSAFPVLPDSVDETLIALVDEIWPASLAYASKRFSRIVE